MTYPLQNWRLLITASAPGAWNMSIDEAILEAVGSDKVQPTLRLYAWNPPCISIGYAQSFSDIDLERLHLHGWEWVRRPTGGRAILHIDELTYSVVAPSTDARMAGSVLESYQRLSKALLSALHSMKIPAKAHPLPPSIIGQEAGAVCFEVPSNYEIVVQGKKLVGSAQARRKIGVLQHGSLPLVGDLTRITQALRYSEEINREEASARLLEHATTAETVLGYPLSWDTAARSFVEAFQAELNIGFVASELSRAEHQKVDQLVREKYAQPGWLERI
jgi:lipoate-protein ligase A